MIELMIVMFILAILMAVMIPNWIKAKYRAHLAGCMQNERACASALEVYRTEHDTYPNPGAINTGHVLFTGRYIQPGEIRCPSNSSFYNLDTTMDAYTMTCNGIHHLLLPIPSGYPQYSTGRGLIME